MTALCIIRVGVLLLLPLLTSQAEVKPRVVSAVENKPLTLTCPAPADKSSVVFLYWDVSSHTMRLEAGASTPTLQVIDRGWTLYIPLVKSAHYGSYICAYNATNGVQRNYIELSEVRPSTFDRYRLNILIGVVSAVVALVILLIVYLVYIFHWERRHGLTGSDHKYLVRRDYSEATTSSGLGHMSFTNVDEAGYPVSDVTITNTKL